MPSRSYHQYCALARALDVVGDRWSLLIVRNLVLGPLRWSELVDTLPGIAKNLLSSRLTALMADKVIERDGDVYGLTARGAELEAVLFALGNWGERHLLGPPRKGDAIRLRYLMTSIRRRLRPSSRRVWLGLVVDGESYSVRLGDAPTVIQGKEPSQTAIETDLAGLRSLLMDRRPIADLVQAGMVSLRGDVADVQGFVDAFPPP